LVLDLNQEEKVRVRRFSMVFMMLAFGFLTACASGGTSAANETPAGGAAQQGMAVQIDNNVAGAQSFIVFMVPEAGGVRQQIGRIDPGETLTFPYAGSPGNYVIELQGPSSTRRSERFRMFASSLATWRVDRNNVTVTNRGD
jgi:hypothetical protein